MKTVAKMVPTEVVLRFYARLGCFTYSFDPILVAGAAKVVYNTDTDKYDYVLQPSVMYALSDELKIGGELYYNSKTGAAVETALGVGGLYKSDVVMVNGGVYYDFKSSGIGAYGDTGGERRHDRPRRSGRHVFGGEIGE